MDIYTILISKNTNLSTVELVSENLYLTTNLGIKKDMKIKKSNVYITK